jgi:hypothetical protein
MKTGVVCLTVPFVLASVAVLAQDEGGAMEKLRACSLLAHAQRLECLEKLSRDIGPTASQPSPTAAAPPPSPAENWVVSETRSPLDYSPVVVATAAYAGTAGSLVKLSIECRGDRTELVIDGPALAGRGGNRPVSYRIDDGQPVAVASAAPTTGTGIAVKGDVVRLLMSLPEHGEIAFHVTDQSGPPLEGRYSLAGLKRVLKRMTGPCGWRAAGPSRD